MAPHTHVTCCLFNFTFSKENEALISLVKHITQQAINMSLANKLSQTMKKSSNQTTDEENGVGDDVTDQQNRGCYVISRLYSLISVCSNRNILLTFPFQRRQEWITLVR